MAAFRKKKCVSCDSPLELGYLFCPICGNSVARLENVTSSGNSRSSEVPTGSRSKEFSLQNFQTFKRRKEKERSSFFVRKNSRKSSTEVDNDVVIYIGLMKEMCQVKRGEWLPLKIRSSATRDDILKAAVEKHTLFNKLFNPNVKYKLVFKDGSDASKIPGSDPEESFTLSRYKAVSGFSYGKIKLFLIPESTSFQHRIDRMKNCIEELDDDELSSCELDELTQDESSMNELDASTATTNVTDNATELTEASTTHSETCRVTDVNVQCPICLEHFPIKTVEEHAAQCEAEHSSLYQMLPEFEDYIHENDVKEKGPSEVSKPSCVLKDMVMNLAVKVFDPEEERVRITVRRKHIWDDYKRARGRYYSPEKKIKVTFSGESAVDDGGPRREFFSGIVTEIFLL